MIPKFKAGDKVTFVSDYGVVIKGKTIKKMVHNEVRGFCYYITPTDCSWFDISERNLFPADAIEEKWEVITSDGCKHEINMPAGIPQADMEYFFFEQFFNTKKSKSSKVKAVLKVIES